MKKTAKLLTMALSILMMPALPSCNSVDARWNYSKDDTDEFVEEEASYSSYNGVTTFFVEMDQQFFNDSLSSDDVVIFDFTQLCIDDANGKISGDYFTYDVLCKYQVSLTSFEVTDYGIGFDATFETQNNDMYCALVNKSAVTSGHFVFLYGEIGTENGGSDSKVSDAIKEIWGYTKSGLKIAQSLYALCDGVLKADPSKAITNFVSVFDTVAGYAFSSGTSEKDMLKSIDGKIDDLTAIVNKAADKLQKASDQIIIEIDKTNVNILKQSVSSFYTDYTEKAHNYLTIVENYQYKYIKEFIQSTQDIIVYYNKDDDGTYYNVSPQDFDSTDGLSYTFTLTDFTNAKANLEANSNNVVPGFTDALYSDFNENLKSIASKPGSDMRTEAQLDDDIFNSIVQNLYKNYYSGDTSEKNYEKALEIYTLADNYSKKVGGIGTESILATYQDLLKYSYNFASECKDSFVDTCDDFLLTASKLGSLAEIASYYNNNNVIVTELENDYNTALSNIATYQNQFEELDANYNFVNKTVAKGTFIEIKFGDFLYDDNAYFLDFDYEYGKKHYVRYDTYKWNDDINELPYSCYSSDDLTRMYGRYEIMDEIGLLEGQNINNFFDYVVARNIISSAALTKFHRLGSHDYYEKFATDLNYRELTASDTESLTCTYVNTGSKFKVGQSYRFGSSGKAKYWYGKAVTTTFFYPDGSSESAFAAYGAYYWNDALFSTEGYRFGSGDDCYCFLLYSKKA